MAAVLGHVQANQLLRGRHAQQAELLQRKEEGAQHAADPQEDDDHANDLARQELAGATIEDTKVVLVTVRLGHIRGVCHEANVQHTPGAAEAVHGAGLQRVIDLELEQQGGGAVEDKSANKAGDHGSPGLHHGAAGSDGHQAGKEAVADVDEVPGAGQVVLQHQGGGASGASGQGGGHGGAAHHLGGHGGVDGQEGAGVESVPAKPEQEGTEHHQGGGVAGHVHGVPVRIKPAHSGAHHGGTAQPSKSSHHVDDTAAGKVDHASSKEAVVAEGGQPASAVPDPVDDHWVHKAGQEDGVEQVGQEGGALSNGARHDGRGGGGESPLEQKASPVRDPDGVVIA
mmetsp:Transcript_7083/g.18279  ORF Transcript_7083/g.18279 Transcript_7083/m.18279 type:complete len:341 (-) Transcript_7083:580-1602(-)